MGCGSSKAHQGLSTQNVEANSCGTALAQPSSNEATLVKLEDIASPPTVKSKCVSSGSQTDLTGKDLICEGEASRVAPTISTEAPALPNSYYMRMHWFRKTPEKQLINSAKSIERQAQVSMTQKNDFPQEDSVSRVTGSIGEDEDSLKEIPLEELKKKSDSASLEEYETLTPCPSRVAGGEECYSKGVRHELNLLMNSMLEKASTLVAEHSLKANVASTGDLSPKGTQKIYEAKCACEPNEAILNSNVEDKFIMPLTAQKDEVDGGGSISTEKNMFPKTEEAVVKDQKMGSNDFLSSLPSLDSKKSPPVAAKTNEGALSLLNSWADQTLAFDDILSAKGKKKVKKGRRHRKDKKDSIEAFADDLIASPDESLVKEKSKEGLVDTVGLSTFQAPIKAGGETSPIVEAKGNVKKKDAKTEYDPTSEDANEGKEKEESLGGVPNVFEPAEGGKNARESVSENVTISNNAKETAASPLEYDKESQKSSNFSRESSFDRKTVESEASIQSANIRRASKPKRERKKNSAKSNFFKNLAQMDDHSVVSPAKIDTNQLAKAT